MPAYILHVFFSAEGSCQMWIRAELSRRRGSPPVGRGRESVVGERRAEKT